MLSALEEMFGTIWCDFYVCANCKKGLVSKSDSCAVDFAIVQESSNVEEVLARFKNCEGSVCTKELRNPG